MRLHYAQQSIEKYLNDLSGKLPAPGGGSAAALVSSTGVACLLMVANFTLNKKGYETVQDEIQNVLSQLEGERKKLTELIDLDVLAYQKVADAYRHPRDTEEEKATREKQIQNALKEAMDVPLEIMLISHRLLPVAEKLLNTGNKNLITDVGCGAIFLLSGIESAELNVEINLKNITDTGFVETIKKQIADIVSDSKSITKKILADLKKNL